MFLSPSIYFLPLLLNYFWTCLGNGIVWIGFLQFPYPVMIVETYKQLSLKQDVSVLVGEYTANPDHYQRGDQLSRHLCLVLEGEEVSSRRSTWRGHSREKDPMLTTAGRLNRACICDTQSQFLWPEDRVCKEEHSKSYQQHSCKPHSMQEQINNDPLWGQTPDDFHNSCKGMGRKTTKL